MSFTYLFDHACLCIISQILVNKVIVIIRLIGIYYSRLLTEILALRSLSGLNLNRAGDLIYAKKI